MKKAEKEKTPAIQQQMTGNFFEKENGSFFTTAQSKPRSSFFNAAVNTAPASESIMKKKEVLVQKQDEHEDESVTKGNETEKGRQPAGSSPAPSFRAQQCSAHPKFGQVGCLIGAVKLDIDDNLRNNAWHFYQVANLHPGDDKLMTETFMRYGLGINLLNTTFESLGADGKLKTLLSYGTGIGLKAKTFKDTGEVNLDIPIPITKDTSLNVQLDLKTDPASGYQFEKFETFVNITTRWK